MKIYFLILAICLIMIKLSISQDVHFSQFNNTPLLINPSNSGESGGDRFIVNYRNQWRSITKNSYKTYAFSYDTYFSKDKFSMGIMAFKDKAGDGDLSTSQFNATVATKVNFNENNYLKLGLQAGINQKSLDMTNLTWNSQEEGGIINPDLASGEVSSVETESYFDISTGMLYTSQLTESSKMNLGVSAYHLNRAKYSFLSEEKNINIRWNIHLDLEIATSENSNLTYYPSLLYTNQSVHNELNIGGIVKYNLGLNSVYTGSRKQSSFYFGAFYRVKDAIVAYSRLNYRKQFDIAITYDINLSYLNNSTNSKGGFEMSLIYIIPQKSKSLR